MVTLISIVISMLQVIGFVIIFVWWAKHEESLTYCVNQLSKLKRKILNALGLSRDRENHTIL